MSTDPSNSDEEEIDLGNETESPDQISLEQLSQAYAQVMREQGHTVDITDVSPEPTESDPEEQLALDTESNRKSKQHKTPDELDAEDNAACPISPKSIVEAILFVGAPAGTKLTARKLAAVMRDVSPKEIKKIVKELNQDYESNSAAYRIVEDAGNYKMAISNDLLEVQNHFFGRNRPAKLSQGAIDVLAIVAYNQPITRKKVEQIRAKPSGSVLSQLLKRELIGVSEDTKSKDSEFETTNRFLELFGLGALEDLPQTSLVSDLEELSDS